MGQGSQARRSVGAARRWRAPLTGVLVALVAACGSGSSDSVAKSSVSVAETNAPRSKEGSTTTSASVAVTEPTDPFDLMSFGGKIAIQGLKCAEYPDTDAIGAQMGDVNNVDEAVAALGNFTDLNPVMQICLMNPDASDLKVVSDPSVETESPGWSYDQSTLMFRSQGRWWVTDASGSNVRQWDDPTRLLWRLSPDDMQYVNETVHEYPIYVTPVGQERDGPGRRAVIDATDFCCSTFRWSPDSKSLLFYVGLDDCSSLWKIDVESLEATPLTGPGSPNEDSGFCPYYESAYWSPDGSTILVQDYQGLGAETRPYLMNPDGSNLRPLLAEDPFDDPDWTSGPAVWSPDGRAVLVNIVSTPAMMAGEGVLFVVPVSDPQLIPVPVPITTVIVDLAWAPDAPTLNPLPDEDMDAV